VETVLDVGTGLVRGLVLPRIYERRGLMLGGVFLSILGMLSLLAQRDSMFAKM
jgi:hypothetical protein